MGCTAASVHARAYKTRLDKYQQSVLQDGTFNCLGALDGKHIIMTAPAKSGSLFCSIIKAAFQLT